MTGGPPSLADVAETRAATYRLFGALFLSPADEALLEPLAALAAELRERSALVRPFPFFTNWYAVLDSVALLGEESSRLGEEHVRLFQLGGPRPLCPPYESAYLDPSGFARGELAVEVEQAYAEAGVLVAAGGELPDHAVLELEFMSILCGEEAEAWHARDPDEARACLRREEAFLTQHLARWFPAFTRQVRVAASGASFYRQLADAVHTFLVHDRDLVGTLAASEE